MSLNIILVLILAWLMVKIERRILVIIFLLATLQDVINIRLVGTTSLFYLLITLALYLYGQKFKSRNFFYLLFWSLIIFSLDSLIALRTINFGAVFLETAIFLLSYRIFKSINTQKEVSYD